MLRAKYCSCCGLDLPFAGRIDRKYCRPSCRTLAYRRRRDGVSAPQSVAAQPTPPSALVELVMKLEARDLAARKEVAAVRARNTELEESLRRTHAGASAQPNRRKQQSQGAGLQRQSEHDRSWYQHRIAELESQLAAAQPKTHAPRKKAAGLGAGQQKSRNHPPSKPASLAAPLKQQGTGRAEHSTLRPSAAQLIPAPFGSDAILLTGADDHAPLMRVTNDIFKYRFPARVLESTPDKYQLTMEIVSYHQQAFEAICRYIARRLLQHFSTNTLIMGSYQTAIRWIDDLQDALIVQNSGNHRSIREWFYVHRDLLSGFVYIIIEETISAFIDQLPAYRAYPPWNHPEHEVNRERQPEQAYSQGEAGDSDDYQEQEVTDGSDEWADDSDDAADQNWGEDSGDGDEQEEDDDSEDTGDESDDGADDGEDDDGENDDNEDGDGENDDGENDDSGDGDGENDDDEDDDDEDDDNEDGDDGDDDDENDDDEDDYDEDYD